MRRRRHVFKAVVFCSGKNVNGSACRHTRYASAVPETEAWYCAHHRSQDGKGRIVSAVVPGWVHDRANGEDIPDPTQEDRCWG